MKIKLPVANIFLLLFFNTALLGQQKVPSIIWQKCFGGSKSESANSIVKTEDGAYIIAGYSYSNDGDVSGHHGSTDSSDAWIIKVSPAGDLLWQKSYGGSGNDVIYYVSKTNDGGFICLGNTTSNDGDVSGNHGGIGSGGHPWQGDLWVLKLDANGNLQWQKCLGGSGNEFPGVSPSSNILQSADGGYILVGNTNSHDGDVTGVKSYWDSNFMDSVYEGAIWIVKLNNIGNIEWEKTFSGNNGNGNCVFQVAPNRYAIGLSEGESGGQGNSVEFPVTIYPPNSFLAILDSSGNLVDTKTFSFNSGNLSWNNNGPSNIVKGNGNQYFVASWKGCGLGELISEGVTVDRCDSSFSVLSEDQFYPPCDNSHFIYGSALIIRSDGSGVFAGFGSDPGSLNYHPSIGTSEGNDAYLANFAPQGWKASYGGSGGDAFYGIAAENDYAYVAAGYTNSTDGDVSGNKGGFDFWVVKLGNTNTIRGTVFADYNSDGIKQPNEPFVNGIIVQSKKGDSTVSGSVYNGLYGNSVDTGSYVTSVLTGNPYYKAVPATHTSTFTSYSNSDSISYAIQPIQGKRDYRVYIEGGNASVHSLDSTYLEYAISYFNEGTDTLLNKTIKLIKDSNETFLSSDIPSSINGDTITWNISSPTPPETGGGFELKMHFNIAAGKTLTNYLGDTVVSTVIIDTTGDLNTSNNVFILRQPVLSSFDPNDKQEANAGTILSSDVSDGKYLLYTIHFQNTGNDTAYNIVITDSLTAKLDNSSIEMVNASHPYHLSIVNGNKCTWKFYNIKLPDSVKNEPASHGFITYRIKPAGNVIKGDSILNKASIVFDYNLPVETKTQITRIKGAFVGSLPKPLISGLDSAYCNNAGPKKIRITNFPASSYQANVSAQLDSASITIGNDSSFSIDPSSLSVGQHSVKVIFSNSTSTATTINNFKIILPDTPKLSLKASTTIVTSTTLTTTITATDVSGGGDSPQYIFAADRLFNNVIQQSSASNVLIVQASSLKNGDNWIYAGMTTSDTCYTTQTVTDSIKITRNAAKNGMTDPDFPNQLITCYPNPFKYQLTLSGLQVSKTYTVVLYAADGQQLLYQRISNQQQWQKSGVFIAAGVYILRLYDESKGKLIGTVKLVEE